MRNDRRPVPPASAPASADGKRSNKVAKQPLYLHEKLSAAGGANEHECRLRRAAVAWGGILLRVGQAADCD
jgi:hypothetical protein